MGQQITELGYLGFEVSNMPNWEHFATEVLGLEVLPGPTNTDGKATRRLRMDSAAYRFILLEGAADDCAFAGWRAADSSAVEAFSKKLSAMGLAWSWGTDQELNVRSVEKMLHFQDPEGNRHEVFCGQQQLAKPFFSTKVTSGFVTGDGGLGHIVYEANNYPGVVQFAENVLGLKLSDHIYMAVAPEVKIEVSFFHTNERHHSFAVAPRAPIPGPVKRVHHFMIEARSVVDVGLARDRCLAAGLPVVMDIGQHPNDQMISFYGKTPSGFHVEFGCGGVMVDDANWKVGSYDQMSTWGHRPAPVAAPPAT
jgi:biphenyl-2,3-diol 1,2-dioxygenase